MDIFSQAVNNGEINKASNVVVSEEKTGKNKNIRNADFIFLDENTNVKADALINGDGGKLIAFASDVAHIYSNFSVRSGDECGTQFNATAKAA